MSMKVYSRRRLIAVKPYDAEVEYLESGGVANCSLNTGFIPTNTTRVVVRIKDYPGLGRWIFGARRGYLDRSYGIYVSAQTQKSELQFGTNLITIGKSDILTNGFVTIDFNGAVRTCTVTNEYGAIVSTAMGGGVFSAPCPLVLFNLNNNGNITASSSKLKMYDALIYDSDVLVRDFIPVRLGQVGYMYDKISGKLFGNAGTGNFILGPDK